MPRFKKTSEKDGPGRYYTADQLVPLFLAREKELRHKEIKEMLGEHGIRFHDHKGLDGVLERLLKKRIIVKSGKTPLRPYPAYHLPKKMEDRPDLQAKIFANEASQFLLLDIDASRDPERLADLIRMIGFYTIFNYLESYKLRRKDSNVLQVGWLWDTLPMRYVSLHLTGHKIWEIQHGFDVKKYENELRRLFPEEFSMCKKMVEDVNRSGKRILRPRLKKVTIKIPDDL